MKCFMVQWRIQVLHGYGGGNFLFNWTGDLILLVIIGFVTCQSAIIFHRLPKLKDEIRTAEAECWVAVEINSTSQRTHFKEKQSSTFHQMWGLSTIYLNNPFNLAQLKQFWGLEKRSRSRLEAVGLGVEAVGKTVKQEILFGEAFQQAVVLLFPLPRVKWSCRRLRCHCNKLHIFGSETG